MITNKGKDVLGKYLIGQAPAYASYIAIGCGATPLNTDATFGDYSAKEVMDFEMFRVPIISRGFVNEDGIAKIVFTAELPTEERYEVSEVGVFSAQSNPSTTTNDSKLLYTFDAVEQWEYHTADYSRAIPSIYEPLDGDTGSNIIAQADKVFATNADNKIFTNSTRVARYEQCRFYNNTIVMRGDTANLTLDSSNNLVVSDIDTNEPSTHIHLSGTTVNLSKNSPADVIKVAFSVINRNGPDTTPPKKVRLMVEFASTDEDNAVGRQYARFNVDLTHSLTPQNANEYNFTNNRYLVITKQLQDLIKSTGFTWSSIDVVKIYASVLEGVNDTPSTNYYVCLDAIRVDNVSTIHPLYGMTGYSVIKNHDAKTIVKSANSTNFIEFRFAMDVL